MSVNAIAVEAGQCFRVPRAGKAARHVRVTKVMRVMPPRAWCAEVTRTGRKKSGETFSHVLTFVDGRWRMGYGFEEVAFARAVKVHKETTL